jgi:hypothetical protein
MRRPRHNRTPAYLVTDVAASEQSHRRAVLVGIGTLIVLSTAPVFGHHLAVGADSLLAGRDHLGALCLIALHYLLRFTACSIWSCWPDSPSRPSIARARGIASGAYWRPSRGKRRDRATCSGVPRRRRGSIPGASASCADYPTRRSRRGGSGRSFTSPASSRSGCRSPS